ncbi:hypothetical protein EMCRGX_G017196 [Ephydatia muelleri]
MKIRSDSALAEEHKSTNKKVGRVRLKSCAFCRNRKGCSIALAHPSKIRMEYEDEVSSAAVCGDKNCPFFPCALASCPKFSTAVCEVTSSCDPCATVKCSAGRQCYLDSKLAPYCASPCSATFTCPAGFFCQKYPNICEEGLEMTGCGYYGYCLKN